MTEIKEDRYEKEKIRETKLTNRLLERIANALEYKNKFIKRHCFCERYFWCTYIKLNDGKGYLVDTEDGFGIKREIVYTDEEFKKQFEVLS